MSEGWDPAVSRNQADRALEIAHEVGVRLADPRRLNASIESGGEQGRGPEFAVWQPISLAQGHPGLALTFAQLERCFPNDGWGDEAHRQIELSVEALRIHRSAGAGLFGGVAGVAFAARSIDPVRYTRLLDTLDGLLARHTERQLAQLESRRGGVAEADFDVVSGLAGVGAYYLRRGAEAALRPIVAQLVQLLLGAGELPGWYTPAELLDGFSRTDYPHGRLNCGLAHGVPGPLSLLSLARARGFDVEGLHQAIERASAWLVEQTLEDEWGVNWPYAVPVGPDPSSHRPARAAWCYGAPGVARALWLAGTAIGDWRLRELAVEGLAAVSRRPSEVREIDAPTVCHGLAGLLQITLRTAKDSGSKALCAFADELAEQLVDRFEPDSLLGYRDLDPDGRLVDCPGILQGAAGVALTLLAAATPVPPHWDRLFLLA